MGARPVGAYSVAEAQRALGFWELSTGRRTWRMVRLVTEWVHGNTGMTRLWLEVDPDNVASQQVARKAGCWFEQRLQGHCRSWVSDDPAHDSWHDCLIWVHTA